MEKESKNIIFLHPSIPYSLRKEARQTKSSLKHPLIV